jgi:hypothetical protein
MKGYFHFQPWKYLSAVEDGSSRIENTSIWSSKEERGSREGKGT